MKLLLVFCAAIALTHGLPQHSDFNNYDFDFLAFGNFLPFGTDDQPNTPNRNNNVDSGLDRVATNDDKLKCFYEKAQDVLNENRDLEWWFDELQKFTLESLESAEKCSVLTGFAKTRCYFKLQATSVSEIRRLIKLLPEEKRKIIQDQVKDIIKGCLQL